LETFGIHTVSEGNNAIVGNNVKFSENVYSLDGVPNVKCV